MNTQQHRPPVTPRRTLSRAFSALATAASVVLATAAAPAADWYLRLSQPIGNNWNIPASDWNSSAIGNGVNATAVSPADTYHINNYNVRTPAGAGPAAFGGGILRLSGGASAIGIKTTGTAGATIPHLESIGGKIENSEAGTVYLNVTRFNNLSGSTTLSSVSGRTVKLTADTLVGSGELRVINSGSTALLALPDARGYLGQIRLSSGTLNFDTDVSSSGPLVIEGGAFILDQALTFTSLKVGATTYAPGLHPLSELQANHGTAMFPNTAGGSITVKPATTWYLAPADQPTPRHWKTTTDWTSAANGTGTNPVEFRAADTFDTNGKKTLRTPFVNSATDPNNTFTGGQLRITSSNTTLGVKASGTASFAKLPHLFTSAGAMNQNWGAAVRLQIDRWENQAVGASGFTINTPNASTSAGFNLTIGQLFGAGHTRFDSANCTIFLSADDASNYTGDLLLVRGRINFENNLRSAGRLVISTGATVTLDQSVAFTDVLINGVALPVGTHTYADLNTAYPAVFTAGSPTGELIVRSPLDWYLNRSQTGATDTWDMLLHWSSAIDGSGPSPSSINLIDNYINAATNRTLRAPAVASTFPGGALVLKDGGKLMLQTPASATTTVPTFETDGTATIYNGVTGIQQTLAVDRWSNLSGTTVLTTTNGGAGGSLNLRVHYLKGPGNIIVGGNSQVLPYINHGAQFTGSFTVNASATLTVNQTLGLGGSLVVQSGALVVLNKPVYVRALTVAGVSKPLGTYSVASLGAGFSGTGNITVYQPSTDAAQMYGVNFAGGEFPDPNQWPDDAALWTYYQNKGLTLIRVPIKWSRIQSAILPTPTTVNFTKMDQLVALASARGMKIIFDLHNYGAYADGGAAPRLGSSAVPVSAFLNVWTQIADRYKDSDAVYGYDLMNEPHNVSLAIWSDAAQQAVDAIRTKDTKHYILVEGLGASGANMWLPTSLSGNATLDIRDPIGRLVYSAHSYWDFKHDNDNTPPTYSGNDGNYETIDIPASNQVGVNHVRAFVEWVKNERPYAFGNVGEFGIPYNHAYTEQWKAVLSEFLQYLGDNNISTTYWASGKYWGNYPLSCHPNPFPGVDKPQMAVLELFNNNP